MLLSARRMWPPTPPARRLSDASRGRGDHPCPEAIVERPTVIRGRLARAVARRSAPRDP